MHPEQKPEEKPKIRNSNQEAAGAASAGSLPDKEPRGDRATDPGSFCAYVDAGMTLFPCLGYSKVPARKGFLDLPFDPEFVPREHNYGVLLRERFLVIDCDPRHYKENDRPLKRLFDHLGLDTGLCAQSFGVSTPQGGVHIYFRKPETVKTVNSLKEYPGLEFKQKFIMACGSFIDKTPDGTPVMRGYTPRFGSPSTIKNAPQMLLAKLMAPDRPKVTLDAPVLPDNPADVHAFEQHCKLVEPAVEGQNGDLRTWQVACAGREFGLSQQKVFDLMLEHFNPRCQPVWEEDSLRKKVENAFEYSTRTPQGLRSVQNSFTAIEEPKEVKIRYQLDARGGIKKCMHNLKMFFEYPVVHKDKKLTIPPIGSFLRFDMFSHNILWGRPAPWYKSSSEWDDEDAVMFKSILSEQLGIDFSADLIHEVAAVCAGKRVFHPVRDYLESCAWDGISRVDHWLCRYCGTVDSPYSRFIGRKVLVAAVARVYSPGCKFDHVLVTEGMQGIGKSYMWEILASPWFCDSPLHIQDKSAAEVMRGQWVVELAEMDALTKYESRTIKGFLTRTTDRCRMAYMRKAKNYPRQNIFVGSINPELTGWLKDTTGNRRYWPIAVGKVDLKGLKRDRDMLWAEALKIFQQGEQLFVSDEIMLNAMQAEVANRMQEDPWFVTLENYLHQHSGDFLEDGRLVVLPSELFQRTIGGSLAQFRWAEANRVASVLKTLGFTKEKAKNKEGCIYVKPYVEEI